MLNLTLICWKPEEEAHSDGKLRILTKVLSESWCPSAVPDYLPTCLDPNEGDHMEGLYIGTASLDKTPQQVLASKDTGILKMCASH